MVSMDNCAHNGDNLRDAVLTVADGWVSHDLVEPAFAAWVRNPACVSFPCTMIDKDARRGDSPSHTSGKAVRGQVDSTCSSAPSSAIHYCISSSGVACDGGA